MSHKTLELLREWVNDYTNQRKLVEELLHIVRSSRKQRHNILRIEHMIKGNRINKYGVVWSQRQKKTQYYYIGAANKSIMQY